jgi:hypothetical protein
MLATLAQAGIRDEAVAAAIRGTRGRLVQLNKRLLLRLRDVAGLTPHWWWQSAFDFRDEDISEQLAYMTDRVGADTYLSGPSGRRYLNEEPFRERGIAIRYHDYEGPTHSAVWLLK